MSDRRSERLTRLRESQILIVEDDEGVVALLEAVLRRSGYHRVVSTRDGAAVRDLYFEHRPDLIVLDLHLPDRTGVEVLEELSALTPEDEFLPVLVLTGDITAEARQRALTSGAQDFLRKPFDHVEMVLRMENLLEIRHLHRRVQERNQELSRTVELRTRELEVAQVEILERLTTAVELHDDATGQHTRRVAESAARMAITIGLPAHDVDLLRRAAPLHDIGKVGIPDGILLKPGPLTSEEFDIVKTHTTIGARMLSGGTSVLIHVAEEIALSHHERWDGSGYPHGLQRTEIPLVARIVALADFCDALGHDRPYRRAWPEDRIHDEVRRQTGKHFDPLVVDAFFATHGKPRHA